MIVPRIIPGLSAAVHDTIAVMVAVGLACALPGVFLVLRRMVLVGDAISHVLLLGIVVAYLIVRDPASVGLYLGASLSGLAAVALIEALQRAEHLKADAAIGLVFPALFSLGTVLASLYLRNTHLDVDRVLLGSAEFAYRDRLVLAGRDWGPRSFIVLIGCWLVMVGLTQLLYKELQLTTFDPTLAWLFGFSPGLLHYGLMGTVSLVTVAAFDAVGPVLVLAFFTVPAATMRLLTHRLPLLLVGSGGLAVVMAIVGTIVAVRCDWNIAGTVVGGLGAAFALVYAVTALTQRR